MNPKAGRREWIGLGVIALPCLLYPMDLTASSASIVISIAVIVLVALRRLGAPAVSELEDVPT